MKYKDFVLDKFQEDSIKAIENNHSVVVSAPTGSGKTLIADYIINKYLNEKKVIYTSPIKALSNQKYKEFSEYYGAEHVGLLTGDIVKNPDAPILIMTTEVFRNMSLTYEKMLDSVSYVIFDEIHFINDVERGYVWEESIIFAKPHMRFLCLSATIPNADEFASWISTIKGHKVEVVRHEKRPVPLHKSFYDSELGITTLSKIKKINEIPHYQERKGYKRKYRVPPPSHIELIKDIKHKLPCFFFVFSRKKCQDFAHQLAKTKIFKENPKISTIVRKKLEGVDTKIRRLKSTQILREVLPFGVAFHHAGLLPLLKELVEELFSEGLINVLYTTETFAVGINMPAKTVCFESLRKFDGISFRFLNSKEYFQIAGRAGRRGIDKEGFSYAIINRRDFDYKLLRKMTTADKEPIRSQFKLSVNTVLNLIKNHNEKERNIILTQNFLTFQKFGKNFKTKKTRIHDTFNKIYRKLNRLEYIQENLLTEKGEFSSHIYADEILTGELFATDFHKDLNEYQILMLLGALVFEKRERVEFKKLYSSEFLTELKRKIAKNKFLMKEKKLKELDILTALINPCYEGKDIFDIMKNTNLLEGDLIRFFRQILDRIGQIKDATEDEKLLWILNSCKDLVNATMKEIDII